jgi:hypothetical protein
VYADVCDQLARAVDLVAHELAANRQAEAAQGPLLAVGDATAAAERSDDLSAEVVLAQLRSLLADLLRITGMSVLESTDAIPPLVWRADPPAAS